MGEVMEFCTTVCRMFKENTILKVTTTIITLTVLAVSIQNVYAEAKKKEQIIARWEEQLPEDHWIKNDNGKLATIYPNVCGILATEYDMATSIVGQTGDVGTVMGKVMEAEKGFWKRKYELRYADTGEKVTKTIEMKPGESVSLNFYYDNDIQKYDITEEDFPYSYQLWVLSCTEDTKIATIHDGILTANNAGQTLLQIYCDGEIWEYPVIVN